MSENQNNSENLKSEATSTQTENVKAEEKGDRRNPYVDAYFANRGDYSGYGNAGSGNQYDQYGEQKKKSDGFAIASMVTGIVGLCLMIVSCCSLSILSIPCGIVAIVFGALSRSKNGKNGMATAGLVTGIISLVLSVLIVIFLIAVYATPFIFLFAALGALA